MAQRRRTTILQALTQPFAPPSPLVQLIKYHFDTKNCPIDIMEDFSGDTVLISACRMGRIDVVALALERGAR